MYSRYCKMFIMVCSLVITGILFSCNDYSPIFASIENEELIQTSNLPDKITTLGMAKLNDTYYMASGGAMYHRKVDEKDWDRTSLPSYEGASYEGVSSLVQVDERTAYVILIKDFYVDISEYALYRIEVENNNVKFSSSPIRTISARDGAIEKLFAVYGTNNVYAAVDDYSKSGYRYYQNYQNDNPDELQGGCKGFEVCDDSITGVAEMNGVVYISTLTELFKLEDNTLTEVPIKVGTTALKGWIRSIYYSKKYKKLYLSNDQYIWTLENPDKWARSSKRSDMLFTSFIDIDETGFQGVLVGTQSDAGYREIKDGDISSISTPTGNKYTSGNLKIARVLGFFLDDSTLFVFTNSDGIWRGTYTNIRDVDWFLE